MSHPCTFITADIAFGLPRSVAALGYGVLAGGLSARLLRRRGWHWSWGTVGLPAALLVWPLSMPVGLAVSVASFTAVRLGRRWHGHDLASGGDLAHAADAYFTPLDAARLAGRRVLVSRSAALSRAGLMLGHDARGRAVRVPVGTDRGGVHTLVLGATGSGKTVTQASIAERTIARGHGVIVVDPKGDAFLRERLAAAASLAGATFIEWSPDGPSVFNPFARGAETEIADKALAGEEFTEPHYLRQAQRYLGHVVRVLRAGGETISLRALVTHLEPVMLEVAARRLPDAQSQDTFAYLDSLTARQIRDLSGTRDRLAVLAESDVGRWLDPQSAGVPAFDLLGALTARAVVYFRLDADRRPLLAQMLGAAIVQDLITTVSALQSRPMPSLVMIDEFSAVGTTHIARLFGRARSAGVSLLLGTQELADLRPPGHRQLLDQVLGNLSVLIAHRQVVPDSAALVSEVAGTRGAWSTTQRSDGGRTRTRSREFRVHPDEVRAFAPGWAAVVTMGVGGEQRVRVTRVQHPGARPTR